MINKIFWWLFKIKKIHLDDFNNHQKVKYKKLEAILFFSFKFDKNCKIFNFFSFFFLKYLLVIWLFDFFNDLFFYISANPCKIDKQIGPCNGPFQTKYYYDQVTKQCKSFQWGGCQPNANNFPSLAACQRQCPSTICTYNNKFS
jgi:hypothetical protein